MKRHPRDAAQARPAHTRRLQARAAVLALAASLCTLGAGGSVAHAGSYVISNCPAAGNSDAGAWTITGSPQSAKASCSNGAEDFIGPRGGSMSPGSIAGVQINVPPNGGITITEAKVWWQAAHQLSGADTFAIAADNAGTISESATPLTGSQPSTFVLPGATQLQLANYCSNDDHGNGCVFGSGENEILELYGSQLTLHDSTAPTGEATGGALAGSGPVTGTASISYQAAETSSGIDMVQLRVDGQPVAEKIYASSCSYTTFQACPPSVSNTLEWNSAILRDGDHRVELLAEDAAHNAATVYAGQIETENAPVVLTEAAVSGKAAVGSTLTGSPATFTSPEGAGALSAVTGQWLRCSDAEGSRCSSIPGASSATYSPTTADVGYYLVYQSSVSNSDGSTSADSAPTLAVSEPAKEAASSGGQSIPGGTGGTGGAGDTSGGNGGTSSGAGVTVNLNTPRGGPLGSTAPWQITLKVSRKRVHRGMTIRLKGRVPTTPRPAKGKLVWLRARSVAIKLKGRRGHRRRVRVFGKWITFAVLRTGEKGRFSTKHRFRIGGHHVYEFEAVAPQEAGYLNHTGVSRAVTVREQPAPSRRRRG